MHRLTVTELNRLGDATGFRYRLPHLSPAAAAADGLCVVEGRVQHTLLRPGIRLTLSDVVSHHHYEASSTQYPPFAAIVMLAGRAVTRIGRQPALALSGRTGAVITGSDGVMTGIHPPGQQMRSLNVSVDTLAAAEDAGLLDLIEQATRSPAPALRPWSLPGHLVAGIEQLFQGYWQGTLHRLLSEGTALQVLATALQAPLPARHGTGSLPARDRQRLERVRELLYTAPGEDHSLESLARVGCMSPSSLRSKFQQAYQCSIFCWLRERRLEVAHAHLLQGWSVQQAAHFVGYRHASNFATAFRERYGVAPSQLR